MLTGNNQVQAANMTVRKIDAALRQWIVAQASNGVAPEGVLASMRSRGWPEQDAIDSIESVMRDHLAEHAHDHDLPQPCRVPAPIDANGPAIVQALDRPVKVLASLRHPNIIVFGDLLSARECDQMLSLAGRHLHRSATYDLDTGEDHVHEGRTSEGMFFRRGENPLCARIEARIAALLDWPQENGEGLQVLRYGPGAEYKPHYDYFDPAKRGSASTLAHGGQRVASLVMYLNTPARGGATIFPDARMEVTAAQGNAVFFSYDRPHPMTRTLHGGAPVLEGEKWVATKWLRQSRCR